MTPLSHRNPTYTTTLFSLECKINKKTEQGTADLKQPKGKWGKYENDKASKDKGRTIERLDVPQNITNRKQPEQPEKGNYQPESHKTKSLPNKKVQLIVNKKLKMMNIKLNVS